MTLDIEVLLIRVPRYTRLRVYTLPSLGNDADRSRGCGRCGRGFDEPSVPDGDCGEVCHVETPVAEVKRKGAE